MSIKIGTEIAYTITEDAVANYTTSVSGNDITNSHTPETISVSRTKTWNDNNNQDGKRPASITVNLFADGTQVDSKKVTADDGWAYSFTGLPKYNAGTEIVYTVSEKAVNGYTTAINGYDITNSHTPETISINVEKVWEDNGNEDGIRPDTISIELLADDIVVAKAEIKKSDNWKYTFKNLDKYKAGKEITYRIKEIEVDKYSTRITGNATEGFVITNKHYPTKDKTPSDKTPSDDKPTEVIEKIIKKKTKTIEHTNNHNNTVIVPVVKFVREKIVEPASLVVTRIIPRMGDNSNVIGATILLIIAAIALIILKRRKK